MSTSKIVCNLCEKEKINISELARRIGQSPQNLNKKLQRDTLTLRELTDITDVAETEFKQEFGFEDGTAIDISLKH